MEWIEKLLSAALLTGQVFVHLVRGRIHWRNTVDQLAVVGTESVLVAVITAITIGMVFTIQVAREFITFGASSAIGGVLALALTRELAPVLTAVIIAGRVGSAFAAEVGTMRVTEQIDALEVLRTDPIDYLVVPRVIACAVMVPVLTVVADVTGLAGGLFITTNFYQLSASLYLESAQRLLDSWDLIAGLIKAAVFGVMIALIGSNWGLTTTGGARGVGRSTTQAVVTALLAIFIVNFLLSALLFQGSGQALQRGF
ncbi:MlaE family lipid ABC transporter permease subunit [Gloeobacter kilaueensis]|uniref:ABC transport system permease protein n=1 Tax=Gloeobacter kilaueensis (strain ATCC BAA-2537 / CCAP 1431/1 / ULC 316 / JS1) TaxID=1183438 RepID=U5QJ96_GLOK1|nr:MlaE family lipid ABC transporter permease subunit [Gloeobacter kilaueensis]AGY57750.1 ABC transport system permease protein [Gloeobacter kilaueensis JS1]